MRYHIEQSHEVDDCYDKFKSNLGNSDQNSKILSQIAMECLMDINDVLTEMDIIKTVLDHRASVWEKMHDIPPRTQNTLKSSNALYFETVCKLGVTCDPYEVRDSLYGDTDKIERNAKSVQKKNTGQANELVSLLQGQAGTENAL
ncbi:hypothetical protein F4806DRAFT_500536 [Annulohypoxylon nitens]|nr:hypothetical protein F4806DRAFT_500536 [Annulohypoxylon nitens]